MAEANPENVPSDDDDEGLKFAKALYHFIWQKFYVLDEIPSRWEFSGDRGHFREDIGKAIICEQMLTRDFWKEYLFPDKQRFILQDTDTAYTLCKSLYEMSTGWDFFKRLLRCTALIAEFFIYRHDRLPWFRVQLKKAPLILNAIFKKYFANEFDDNGGWQGLLQYSQSYRDVYRPLEKVISRLEAPYDGVNTQRIPNIPDMDMPQTKTNVVFSELFSLFKDYHTVFAWRLYDSSPDVEDRQELDINEDSGEGSSGSKSCDSKTSDSSDDMRWRVGPPGISRRIPRSRPRLNPPDISEGIAGISMPSKDQILSLPTFGHGDESDKSGGTRKVRKQLETAKEELVAAVQKHVAAEERHPSTGSDPNPKEGSQTGEKPDDEPAKPK